MSDPNPWASPPAGRQREAREPETIPWWPILVGLLLIATPFVILVTFTENHVPPSLEGALVLTAILSGAALPATVPGTIIYALVAIALQMRRLLHFKCLRSSGQQI